MSPIFFQRDAGVGMSQRVSQRDTLLFGCQIRQLNSIFFENYHIFHLIFPKKKQTNNWVFIQIFLALALDNFGTNSLFDFLPHVTKGHGRVGTCRSVFVIDTSNGEARRTCRATMQDNIFEVCSHMLSSTWLLGSALSERQHLALAGPLFEYDICSIQSCPSPPTLSNHAILIS